MLRMQFDSYQGLECGGRGASARQSATGHFVLPRRQEEEQGKIYMPRCRASPTPTHVSVDSTALSGHSMAANENVGQLRNRPVDDASKNLLALDRLDRLRKTRLGSRGSIRVDDVLRGGAVELLHQQTKVGRALVNVLGRH